MSVSSHDHAPGYRAIRFNTEWITRPLFGILMALIALAVVALGGVPMIIAVTLIMSLAALEWHRCVGAGAPYRSEAAVTIASLALAQAALYYSGHFWAGLVFVAAGTVAAFVLARRQGKHPLWHAAGVPYLTIPALALLALRMPPHGAQIVAGMLLIIWATDTGALITGKLIGGPRLAPKLSPGKTWAGTIGGSLIAAIVFCAYVVILMGGRTLLAAPFAFVFSIVAHGGDLFESWVKRHFGLKDSGNAIPGHGGVLDRIDSTLAAAPVMAFLVLVLHVNPLFAGHS